LELLLALPLLLLVACVAAWARYSHRHGFPSRQESHRRLVWAATAWEATAAAAAAALRRHAADQANRIARPRVDDEVERRLMIRNPSSY
jgi:hypothetical protein